GRKVAVVGHSDTDLDLTDAAVVVEDLADHLAVGNDHAGSTDVPGGGVEKRDGFDHSLHPGYCDVLTDAKGLGKDNRKASYEIAENPLRGECHPSASDAEPSHERQQLDTEILQREQREEQRAECPGDPTEQQPQRGLEVATSEKLREPAAQPPAHEDPGGEDQQRSEQPRTETDRKLDERVLRV